jgi:hypothetical protein
LCGNRRSQTSMAVKPAASGNIALPLRALHAATFVNSEA